MNFYLNLIDHKLKQEQDHPTIGIILCRDKKGSTVEFALKGIDNPLGVSEYILTEKLPESFKETIPSVEEFTHKLKE